MNIERESGAADGVGTTAATDRRRLVDEINAIADHCSSLPVLDDRSPEEILGYDEIGLPR
jgi:hypothetical protein